MAKTLRATWHTAMAVVSLLLLLVVTTCHQPNTPAHVQNSRQNQRVPSSGAASSRKLNLKLMKSIAECALYVCNDSPLLFIFNASWHSLNNRVVFLCARWMIVFGFIINFLPSKNFYDLLFYKHQ